jgi:HPr kinase/phosphorylase
MERGRNMEKTISIFEYANHFGLIWANGDKDAMKRQINSKILNRPGIELAGFFDYKISSRLLLLGNKECRYLNTLTDEQIETSMNYLMTEECPGMIVAHGNRVHPTILKIAKEKNFPLFITNKITSDIFIDSVSYLDEKLSPSTSLHGTLVDVFSMGVVIMGESGIGKSETALELLKKGHHLVSDDRVDVTLTRGELIGRAPDLLVNMMEVRGIGIIDVAKMFGVNTVVESKKIDLFVKLVPLDGSMEIERLGGTTKYYEILGENVPIITIPVTGARSVGDIIEVAVTNYKLKKRGYDSTYEFEERLNELLKKGE